MMRPLRKIVEILLAAVFLFGLAAGGLLWRVSQSPLHIDKYIPELQTLAQSFTPNLKFLANNAVLNGGKASEAFEIVLNDVTLLNNTNEMVGNVQTMALGFSWQNLLMLNVTPSTIVIKGPSLQLARYEDGHIGFSITDEATKNAPLSFDTIGQMFAHAPEAFREVNIEDAWVQFEDKKDPLKMEAKNGTIHLIRNKHEINGTLKIDLSANDFHQTLKGSILYDTERHVTQITMGASALSLAELSKVLTQIPKGLSLDTPITAMAQITIDRKFQPLAFSLDVKGSKGDLSYPPYFPQPLTLTALNFHTVYNVLDDSLTIEHLHLATDTTEANIQGTLSHLRDASATKTIRVQAEAKNVPISQLNTLWPKGAGEDARLWVVAHLRDGLASKATLHLEGSFAPDKSFHANDVGGNIDFHGVTVDYLPPMEIVKNATGRATFDKDNFNILTSDGDILQTKVTAGDIRISHISTEDPHIDMLFDLNGPFKDTIQVIATKPLEFPQSMGLNPEQFTSGQAQSKLYLGFPLRDDLTLPEVNVKSASLLQDMTIKNIVRDVTAKSAQALLKVDRSSMTLTGPAVLSDAAAQVTWQEFFGTAPKIQSDIRASGSITPGLLRDLRLPADVTLEGSASSTIHLIKEHDADIGITLTADLKNAGLSLAEWNVTKARNSGGKLALDLALNHDGTTLLSNASLSFPNVTIPQAMARWDNAGNLESATLKDIKVGRTQGNIVVTPQGTNAVRVVMNGPALDLSGYWSKPAQKEVSTGPRYDVSLRTDTLYLDPNVPLTRARLDLTKQGSDLVTLDMHANVEDAVFTAKQTQNPDGSRTLNVTGTNSGKILQALDITDTVRGGTLRLNGKSTPQSPRRIEGLLRMDKFTIIKAPVLAQLINALNPRGLLELLNNNGLNFDTLQSKIIFENPALIRLREGRLTGASLGMGFLGRVYRDTNTVSLKGTLVPIEGLNKFASKIPLIGQILTGINGEGILAATYTIKGPTNNPNVTVNPLSALAPGILRSIFFENSKDE